MRAASRLLCGLAVGLIGCLVVPQPAAAAPCEASGRSELIYVSGPSLLTFGRSAGVFVEASERADADEIENVRLEYRNSQGDVSFSRSFTSRDVARLANDDAKPLRFPIRIEQGAGPVVVRLSYTQTFPTRDGNARIVGEERCEVERQLTVRPFAGVRPRPNMRHSEPLGNGMAEFGVGIGVRCHRLAHGALRIVVRHHAAKRSWRLLSEPCDRTDLGDSPRLTGQGPILPGLRGTPLSFDIVANRRWARDYRVEVFWNGKLLFRRWVRIRITFYAPRERIYRSNPEFGEYCASGLSKGPDVRRYRDAKGRVYCISGAAWLWRGKIFKTRPERARP